MLRISVAGVTNPQNRKFREFRFTSTAVANPIHSFAHLETISADNQPNPF